MFTHEKTNDTKLETIGGMVTIGVTHPDTAVWWEGPSFKDSKPVEIRISKDDLFNAGWVKADCPDNAPSLGGDSCPHGDNWDDCPDCRH